MVEPAGLARGEASLYVRKVLEDLTKGRARNPGVTGALPGPFTNSPRRTGS
jgi:hypothetical protein